MAQSAESQASGKGGSKGVIYFRAAGHGRSLSSGYICWGAGLGWPWWQEWTDGLICGPRQSQVGSMESQPEKVGSGSRFGSRKMHEGYYQEEQ